MNSETKDLRTLLASNIRSAREQLGYSQQRLAEAAHISPGHMNDIEQGRKWVSAETLRQLSTALMTEPWKLFLPKDRAFPHDDTDLLTRFAAILHKNFSKTLSDSWEEALHTRSSGE